MSGCNAIYHQSTNLDAVKLSLLYTTARPWLISKVANTWLTNVQDVELLVVTDTPVEHEYQHPMCYYHVNTGRANCVAGWNMAAQHATGDVLIQVSDDLMPPPVWDSRIRDWMRDRPMGVLNLLDRNQARAKCHHPVIAIEAYRAVGMLYPPEFESLWCDDWFHAYHSRFSDYYTSDFVFWTHTSANMIKDGVASKHASFQRHQTGQQLYAELVNKMGRYPTIQVIHLSTVWCSQARTHNTLSK